MTKYYNGGGTPPASGDAKLFIAEFLGGFPDAYEFIDIEDGSYITKGDPYWRFGITGGDQVVEIGLWDDFRIQISDGSGIQGWDESGSEWIDLLVGGGDGGGNNYIHLQDQKAAGTAGGAFTLGAWRTRVLNVEVIDQPAACTLAANQFTLDAGTYIIIARAPAYDVGRHKLKLYNITDASDELQGMVAHASSASNVGTSAYLAGAFTIATQKAFELQHQSSGTSATGFGVAGNFGVTEIYADVQLWKVA